jgi:hypothetical protein
MRLEGTFARCLILGLGLTFSTDAMAQAVNFNISFTGRVDCHQPIAMNNIPIRGEGTGTLHPDGSATAELTQTAIVLSSTVRFRGRLGAAPSPAPGGTSQIRVAGRDSLRLIWNLPNNQLVVHVQVRGQSCSARFEPILRPGKTQYTLFDGSTYHYCGRPRAERSSCQVR